MILLILFITLLFLSFVVVGLIFLLNQKIAQKPWNLCLNYRYFPKVSIIIPTYNESNIIKLKLINTMKVDYPQELIQLVVVDSNSEDNTLDIVTKFVKEHNFKNALILCENERKGKSSALNFALAHCTGDVIIVSDADCFWPSNILRISIPFLSLPDVGAISGQKVLLNDKQSWVTKLEAKYLREINLAKVGESKYWSTLFFEGGFSAYKKEVLTAFDKFNTGSDDCGTLISVAMNNYRAIVVPNALFYTPFPVDWRDMITMKLRRSHQIVRVLAVYLRLILKGKLTCPKKVIAQDIFSYIFAPLLFFFILILTPFILYRYPIFVFFMIIILLISPLCPRFIIALQSYFILLISMLGVAIGREFLLWKKPNDRSLITEEVLRLNGLL